MFSQFKRIVSDGLDELDRLGETYTASVQNGSTSYEQQHEQFPAILSQHGRGYSESQLGASRNGRRSPFGPAGVIPHGSSATAAMPARFNQSASAVPLAIPSSSQRRSPSPTATPSSIDASSFAAPSASGSFSYSRPSAFSPPPQEQPRRGSDDSGDGFPTFGLGGLKRSLSGLPRTSLDLTGLRNSFDFVSASPSTPGREAGNPEWPGVLSGSTAAGGVSPGGAVRPGTSPASAAAARSRRRMAPRAASLSGPFTPEGTRMSMQDPFFFATLQGLPDALKQAAFTPLPKEDPDEELDQIDQELNPPPPNPDPRIALTASHPSRLPNIRTHSLSISVPPSFRPNSAPAAGPASSFLFPPYAQQPLAQSSSIPRSPLATADSLRKTLSRHDEIDEDAASSASPFSHTAELSTSEGQQQARYDPEKSDEAHDTGGQAATQNEEDTTVQPSIREVEASPLPAFDDLPDLEMPNQPPPPTVAVKAQNVPFGRLSASSTPRRGRSPAGTPAATPTRGRSPERPSSQARAAPSSIGDDSAAASAIASTGDIAGSSAEPVPQETVSALSDSAAALPTKPLSRPPSPAPSLPAPTSAPAAGEKAASTKPESLAARLARISRGTGHVHQHHASPSSVAATASDPLQGGSTVPGITPAPVPAVTPAETPKAVVAEAGSEELKRLQTRQTAFDKLLAEHALKDLEGLRAVLQDRATTAASRQADADAKKKLLDSQMQLMTRVTTLDAQVKEAQVATAKAESRTKEEEEKKAKSITLLKAVRQKLIKAEKDREEAEIIRDATKASEESLSLEVKQLRQRYEQETIALRSSQEQQLAKLRASYEREAQSIRAAYEREAAARRGQNEMDILGMRSAHARELAARDGRISNLETGLRDTRQEKDTLFSELQSRQAEVERAVAEREHIQVAFDELQYEHRESADRITALQDEVSSFKKARLDQTRDEGHTRRLLSELEAGHADRMRGYEERVRTLERERAETEESMARKLQEKLREVERMRAEVARRDTENGEETQRREERQQRMDRAESLNRSLQEKVSALEMLLGEAKADNARVKDDEATTKELLADQTRRATDLEARLEDLSAKESQLRASNKTMREELRKVQAGILLSERSRGSGVGYFSSFSSSTSNAASPNASTANLADGLRSPPLTGARSRTMSRSSTDAAGTNGTSQGGPPSATSALGPAAGPGPTQTSEEALNFEYIRNVILQFLEHKEMRPHLVSVLGVILQFTPSETRRLTAKASA